MARFVALWAGQVVSLVGSGLTGFALGVWVLERTGSVTRFALISLATTLPGIILAPFAGALVDRWDRRRALMLSDAGSALATLALALLLGSGRLEVWHIYLAMLASSTFSAVQWPAYTSSMALLVPKRHLGRASGLVQFGYAAAQILSPLAAGVLVGALQVHGVILVDFATFLVSLAVLLAVRIPRPAPSGEVPAGGSFLREAAFGWTYIAARPGLLAMLLLFAGLNASGGFVQVLITPMVLKSFGSTELLGLILSVAGCGMLAGGLLMSAWGGPRRRVEAILALIAIAAAALVAGGLRPDPWLVGAAAFVYMAAFPLMNGCSQAIWSAKVPAEVQGRVFAVRRAVAWSTTPVAFFLAGPLADRAERLLAPGGALAPRLGPWLGSGPGRGIGLLFIAFGALTLAIGVVGALYPRLRRLERELDDAIAEEPPGAAAPAATAGGLSR